MNSTLETPPYMTVLIIDDNPSDSALISATLGHAGHHAVCTGSGYEGIAELFRANQVYDLILLDVQMPGVNGLETAKQIRALEREKDLEWRPIIFLSGRMGAHDVAAGIESGGDDYLAKPVDSRVLNAKILAMQRIVTMRRKLIATQVALEHWANTDGLTGLSNRHHFTQRVSTEMARSQRQGTPLTLAYLDLDHFKQIKDTFGHQTGDDVLRAVSTFFTDNVGTENFIGRVGGEEFCLCMPGIGIIAAKQACERYRRGIEGLCIQTDSSELQVTVSIGLTQLNTDNDTLNTLMARADSALYRAKHNGRKRIKVEPASVNWGM